MQTKPSSQPFNLSGLVLSWDKQPMPVLGEITAEGIKMTNTPLDSSWISEAESVQSVRKLCVRCRSFGDMGPSLIADSMVSTLFSESGYSVGVATGKNIAGILGDLSAAIEDLCERIDDADTCYRDPTLSNDGFDSLPEWARDMIVKNAEDRK